MPCRGSAEDRQSTSSREEGPSWVDKARRYTDETQTCRNLASNHHLRTVRSGRETSSTARGSWSSATVWLCRPTSSNSRRRRCSSGRRTAPFSFEAVGQSNAIENGARLQIKKPEAFRNDGETLISDRSEAVTQREERHVDEVAINAPSDMKRAQQRDAEHNALAAAIGSGSRTTTTGMRTETTTTNRKTRTHGKNGWILCASVRTSEEAGMKAWHESLDPEYDHVTTIQRPRDFARALAEMVASQLGPLGAEVTYTHPLSKQRTMHPSQTVFHGPVAYVDDPYTYVEDATNPFEVMLRSVFFKHTRFRDQREYRFVVWTEAEPEERTIDLEVSPEMLATVQPTAVIPPLNVQADHDRRPAKPVAVTQLHPSEQPGPSREATPANEQPQGPPGSVSGNPEEPMTIAMPVVLALLMRLEHARHRFSHMVRDSDTDPNQAAAAFHAERIVVQLLAEFVDPIAGVEWVNGIMMIELKAPDNAGWDARLAVGPLGTARYRITVGQRSTEVSCNRGWMMTETLVEDLKQHGLESWPVADAAGEVVAYVSAPSPSPQQPRKSSSHTSTITRMTIEDVDGLTDAELDRINSEVESGDDDARITRIVVTYPDGQHFTLSGVRAGLGGTYTQRATEGSVTLDVSTMHPACHDLGRSGQQRPRLGAPPSDPPRRGRHGYHRDSDISRRQRPVAGQDRVEANRRAAVGTAPLAARRAPQPWSLSERQHHVKLGASSCARAGHHADVRPVVGRR